MKFVNRGYLIVQPTQKFIDWANKNDEDYNDLQDNEANVYLIEEDFYDDEPVITSNYKKIFLNELLSVTEDESCYPEIKLDQFNLFFDVKIGASVFDAEENPLIAD